MVYVLEKNSECSILKTLQPVCRKVKKTTQHGLERYAPKTTQRVLCTKLGRTANPIYDFKYCLCSPQAHEIETAKSLGRPVHELPKNVFEPEPL